eukprot:scaffold17893_cov80-Skeletonema_marinoi.AAC.2
MDSPITRPTGTPIRDEVRSTKSGGDGFVLSGDRTSSFKENEKNSSSISTQQSEEAEHCTEYRRVTQSISKEDNNNNNRQNNENHHDARNNSFAPPYLSSYSAVAAVGASVGTASALSSLAVNTQRLKRRENSKLRRPDHVKRRSLELSANRPQRKENPHVREILNRQLERCEQNAASWLHPSNEVREGDGVALDGTALEDDSKVEASDDDVPIDEAGENNALVDSNNNNAISRDEEPSNPFDFEEERGGVAGDMDSEEVTDEGVRAEASGEATVVNNDVETTWNRGVFHIHGMEQIDLDKMRQSVFGPVDNRKSDGRPKEMWREKVHQGRGEEQRIRGRTLLPPDDIIRRVTSLTFQVNWDE